MTIQQLGIESCKSDPIVQSILFFTFIFFFAKKNAKI